LCAIPLPEENKETLINRGEVYHKLLWLLFPFHNCTKCRGTI